MFQRQYFWKYISEWFKWKHAWKYEPRFCFEFGKYKADLWQTFSTVCDDDVLKLYRLASMDVYQQWLNFESIRANERAKWLGRPWLWPSLDILNDWLIKNWLMFHCLGDVWGIWTWLTSSHKALIGWLLCFSLEKPTIRNYADFSSKLSLNYLVKINQNFVGGSFIHPSD